MRNAVEGGDEDAIMMPEIVVRLPWQAIGWDEKPEGTDKVTPRILSQKNRAVLTNQIGEVKTDLTVLVTAYSTAVFRGRGPAFGSKDGGD